MFLAASLKRRDRKSFVFPVDLIYISLVFMLLRRREGRFSVLF